MNRRPRNPYAARYGYVSNYRPSSPPAPAPHPKRRHHHRLTSLVVLLVVLLSAHLAWSQHVSAHALAVSRAKAQAVQAQTVRLNAAVAQVNQLIAADANVDISVTTQEIDATYPAHSRQIGSAGDYDAASVGKLLTAADLLHHVEQGTSSLHQNIDGHSAQYWLQVMIVNSDDTAWQELNDYLTHPDLAGYAASLGISDYDVSDNLLSTDDISLLLGKLWQGKLFGASDSQLLLRYMQRANYRNYIVPAVVSGDTVYHKVGIDNDEVNDAAIIKHGDQAFSIVIFTNGNGSYDWNARAQLMQQITTLLSQAYAI